MSDEDNDESRWLKGKCSCDPNRTHGSNCHVVAFWQRLNTPEGKAEIRQAYTEMAARRRGDAGKKLDGAEMSSRMQKCGAPFSAVSALKATLERNDCIDAAARFALSKHSDCPFLALIGPTGVGKTVAAAHVLRDFARRTNFEQATGMPDPLVWVQASEFTRVSAFSADDEARLRGMRAANLLVLDDVGDEGTQLGVAALRDVLMARDAAGRATVVTSNVRPEAFRQRYGEALWDRFVKRGMVMNLQKAKSMRQRARP